MNEQQKGIIKKLEYFTYKHGVRETYFDALEYEALKIARVCELHKAEQRGQRQQEILGRYDKDCLHKFHEICNDIETMLIGMLDDFQDYLGEIYMEIGAGNKQTQQFFTPMCVARFMAKINAVNLDLSKPVITVNEPCAGSGILVLAFLEELSERKVNYTDRVLIVANDVDRNCTNICYLQLAFSGAAAVVQQQNTITQQVIGETFITPAFVLQYPKFSNIYWGLRK